MNISVPLHKLAHARTGDKGNRANISVIAFEDAYYPLLVQELTEDRIARIFACRSPDAVTRYLLPKLGAINFVLEGVLDGGVNDSLNLDTHGKALSFLLLETSIELPPLRQLVR